MLETQSPVVTLAEFNTWTERGRFAENRSFLYRILEARETWETLYSLDKDNPLERTREFEMNEVIAVIFSEILFWHRIVITEYTSYRLGSFRQHGYVQHKRFCWIFMKATTELYNFLRALRGRCPPQFTRREIIRTAIDELEDRKWVELFKNNLMIIDNQFDSSQSVKYLNESILFLSYVYKELYKLMTKMIDDVVLTSWLKANRHITDARKAQVYHAVDLNDLPVIRLSGDDNVAAVYVTPQLQSNSKYRVLIVIVLKSLKTDSLKSIERVLDSIVQILGTRDVMHDQVEIDLVDQYGFGCFGVIRNSGPKGMKPMTEVDPCFLPPLYDRLFIAG